MTNELMANPDAYRPTMDLQAVRAEVQRAEAIAEYNRETVLPLLGVLDAVAHLHRQQHGTYTFEGNEVDGPHCGECREGGGEWPCRTARALGLHRG